MRAVSGPQAVLTVSGQGKRIRRWRDRPFPSGTWQMATSQVSEAIRRAKADSGTRDTNTEAVGLPRQLVAEFKVNSATAHGPMAIRTCVEDGADSNRGTKSDKDNRGSLQRGIVISAAHE